MIYSDADMTIDYIIIENTYYQLTKKAIDFESIADEILREDYLEEFTS